jgi:hypothetical protein
MTFFAAGVGSAFADTIYNYLDASLDVDAEVMALNVDGGDGTTTLALVTNNGDGKSGCNLTGSTTVTLSVDSSDSAVATVSPTSVTFDSCGFTQPLTVTPLQEGSATISLSETANTTDGTFDLAPATFTVNVTAPAPANTAPTVSVTGVSMGAEYPKGSVPAATCEVTDAEDGPSSFPADLSSITGPYASDGIGSQTASCDYTDGGGLPASSSVTYSISDETAPTIGYTLSPATPDGDNGWYRSSVALTWDVADSDSPNSLVKTGCVDQVITADQLATDYTCAATSAGGSAGPVTANVKRDATAPTVTDVSASGTLGNNGWYTSPVTVGFDVDDATSGAAATPLSATSPAGAEGSAVVIFSPAAFDNAGNMAPAGSASRSVPIDLTNPVATFDSSFASSYYFGQVPAAPTCTASDEVSGPVGCTVTGYSTAVGPHTLTATATDASGRTGSATLDYEVKAWTISAFYAPVDMNGIWNTVKGGSTIPLKFELFAGPTELTDVAAIDRFVVNKVSCTSGSGDDAVELLATGGTTLRYDSTAGQFIQNWQTPKLAGACYSVSVTTDDGSASKVALFKLK